MLKPFWFLCSKVVKTSKGSGNNGQWMLDIKLTCFKTSFDMFQIIRMNKVVNLGFKNLLRKVTCYRNASAQIIRKIRGYYGDCGAKFSDKIYCLHVVILIVVYELDRRSNHLSGVKHNKLNACIKYQWKNPFRSCLIVFTYCSELWKKKQREWSQKRWNVSSLD